MTDIPKVPEEPDYWMTESAVRKVVAESLKALLKSKPVRGERERWVGDYVGRIYADIEKEVDRLEAE